MYFLKIIRTNHLTAKKDEGRKKLSKHISNQSSMLYVFFTSFNSTLPPKKIQLGVDLGSKGLTCGKKVFLDQNEIFWKKTILQSTVNCERVNNKMATILYPPALVSVNYPFKPGFAAGYNFIFKKIHGMHVTWMCLFI